MYNQIQNASTNFSYQDIYPATSAYPCTSPAPGRATEQVFGGKLQTDAYFTGGDTVHIREAADRVQRIQ